MPRIPLTPGTASRIMTGAPIPEGADAVVPVEQSELVDNKVVRLQQVDPSPGQNVLPLGAAMRVGDIVIRRGALIRPIEIAILAETGHASVPVIPRPRLAILTTGNELVAVDAKTKCRTNPQQQRSHARRRRHARGAAAAEIPTARDTHDDLTRSIAKGLEADVLVLSGGVSAGKFDLVPQVLAELGVEQVFHKIALRPGKPLWFGTKQDGRVAPSLVFGLPGNPVSSLVCFELFVRPALASLSGRGFTQLKSVTAAISHDYNHSGGRAACLPAQLDQNSTGNRVTILPWQGSADLATLAKANGLVRLPAENRQFPAGTPLEVLPL